MRSIILSLFLSLLWSSLARAEDIRIERGQDIFMTTCYQCHPLTGNETGKIAPRIVPMDLISFGTGLWNQSHFMLKAFQNAGVNLPLLERSQIIDLFLFTQIITDSLYPGDPDQGKTFVASNRCLSCHSIAGKGKKIGVNWDEFANVLHPARIISAVWTHRRQMLDAFREEGLPLPKLKKNDLSNLIAFMRREGRVSKMRPVLVNLKGMEIDPNVFTRSNCNHCHSVSSFVGSPHRSIQQISDSILSHAFMPQFERSPYREVMLSPDEATALTILIFYYGHLGKVGDADRGKRVFETQYCINCHDVPGRISSNSEKKSIEPIRDEWDFILGIFNKVPRILIKAKIGNRAFPRLTPEELADLYAYLRRSFSSDSRR